LPERGVLRQLVPSARTDSKSVRPVEVSSALEVEGVPSRNEMRGIDQLTAIQAAHLKGEPVRDAATTEFSMPRTRSCHRAGLPLPRRPITATLTCACSSPP